MNIPIKRLSGKHFKVQFLAKFAPSGVSRRFNKILISTIVPTPLSFNDFRNLAINVFFLYFLQRVFRLSVVEVVVMLALFVLMLYQSVTDGQTDIRTKQVRNYYRTCISRYATALLNREHNKLTVTKKSSVIAEYKFTTYYTRTV